MFFPGMRRNRRVVPLMVTNPHSQPEVEQNLNAENENTFTVSTTDYAEHSFFGIMFDIEPSYPPPFPLRDLEISSLWVGGALGNVKVWVSQQPHAHIFHDRSQWQQVFSRDNIPPKNNSRFSYAELELNPPLRLTEGKPYGVYIHSSSSGTGIRYDVQRQHVSFQNDFFQVHSGLGHVNAQPFASSQFAGGWTWRPCRSFAGKITFRYKPVIWDCVREVNSRFSQNFRKSVMTVLTCNQRNFILPQDTWMEVFRYCAWHWFEPSGAQVGYKDQNQPMPPDEEFDWSGSSANYMFRVESHQDEYLARVHPNDPRINLDDIQLDDFDMGDNWRVDV